MRIGLDLMLTVRASHDEPNTGRAALPSVIAWCVSDFHSLMKSNIWYLRSESARDRGRVKTEAFNLRVESFSRFHQSKEE